VNKTFFRRGRVGVSTTGAAMDHLTPETITPPRRLDSDANHS
jgi:hypothetical protein